LLVACWSRGVVVERGEEMLVLVFRGDVVIVTT